jgi:hypothetical protein
MTSQHFAGLASLVVFLLGAGYHLGWHRDVLSSLPEIESLAPVAQVEPVLILLLGSEESVERVRSAIASERIVASSRGAFAIDGGRIVAVDVESASDPLNAAGWADRPLEILTPDHLGQAPVAGAGESTASAPSLPPLAELAKKPTLTMGEATRLLEHIQ